ncbi:SDR family NAD(P)-dependent oxidoreductase [Streptomyces griseosporeus]|uniref:SDR family NAD(P)-dependent oxidoreductase n=1 Tax=Streptomyces griseosporeus TaxID=1910 RepID=UPI0036FCE078
MSKRVLITGGALGPGRALLASSVGLLNTLGMTSYNASKAAVISLSETIRDEPAPFGVRTTVVRPGSARTDLRAGLTSPDPDLAELVDRTIRDSTAEQVAVRITDAADRGRSSSSPAPRTGAPCASNGCSHAWRTHRPPGEGGARP